MQVWRNWQTRKIQVLIIARLCGFKSLHLHHFKSKLNHCVQFRLFVLYTLL